MISVGNILIFISLVLVVILLGKYSSCGGGKETLESEPTPKQQTYRFILQQAKEVLDNLNVPFFLSSGTCLGYARERDFMEHDYDIDIGIDAKDYTPKIIDEMGNRGLYLYRILGSLKTGMELSFYLPFSPTARRAKIDIFIHKDGSHEQEEKTCWFTYSRSEKNTRKKLKYCVKKFGLKEIDFLGIKVNVPDPIKDYLEEHYGKDWRIPKTNGMLGDYKYDSSPLSLVADF